VALLAVASGMTVAEAQDSGLTWRQVEAFQRAFQNCMGQHGGDPSGCEGQAQRYWDALKRLRPGEGPVLTLPALPRETACDPSYWARKLGSTTAGSQQAATLAAVQAILDLYHCHVSPTPQRSEDAPPPQPAESNVLVCEQALDRYRRAFAEASPGADPAVIGMGVEKVMRMIGCFSNGPAAFAKSSGVAGRCGLPQVSSRSMSPSQPASNVLACQQALARLTQELGAANPGADPVVIGMAMEKRMQMIGCMAASPQ
jgi:hypothetical protein